MQLQHAHCIALIADLAVFPFFPILAPKAFDTGSRFCHAQGAIKDTPA